MERRSFLSLLLGLVAAPFVKSHECDGSVVRYGPPRRNTRGQFGPWSSDARITKYGIQYGWAIRHGTVDNREAVEYRLVTHKSSYHDEVPLQPPEGWITTRIDCQVIEDRLAYEQQMQKIF